MTAIRIYIPSKTWYYREGIHERKPAVEKKITYRQMAAKDYKEAYALWMTEHMGINSVDDTYEGIERFLQRNPTTSLVACDEEKIVATMLCGHDGRQARFHHLCVMAGYQGYGIGTRLVELACEKLLNEGISIIDVSVYTDNGGAKRFYNRLGFEEIDPGFLINMSKELIVREWYD